ncbi:MAG: hypothetical protein IPG43_21725 [Proteobacteria bacterium]|nr:hypothetical protein [Pseudomonadota bacterium]
MRNRHHRATPLLLLLLLAIAPLQAAGPADETAVAGPRDVPDRIEYLALPLSEDALHPRKEISDEQAIPLPDDF